MVLYQNGDYGAFEELYERHSAKVYAYLRGHLPRQSDADDLHQLVFLRLHEHRSRYNATFPFLPWIFSITRNALIDFLRKKRAIPVGTEKLEFLANDPGAGSGMGEGLDLEPALASLSKAERELIQLRFQEGLSFEDIAKRLGLHSPTVRKRMSRTLQSLKKLFEGRHE